jgi:hypothetical protein
MESIQADQEDNDIRMMVGIYMFTYARKLREAVEDLTRKHCYGCRIDQSSQRNHPCLMLAESERLNIFVDDAMEDIDCQEVLNLWKNETKLIDISQKLKDTFERLLQNSEWREMHLPKKDEFYDMAKRTIQLDHRVYQ